MKTKLIVLVGLIALMSLLFLSKNNSKTASESKPIQWLNNVKESLPLPRLLKSKPRVEDVSSLSIKETEEEIQKLDSTITDAKTIEELNKDNTASRKRDEMELLMRRKNQLTDHLLDLKMKELTERANTVLGAQQEIIQNSIKEMENE